MYLILRGPFSFPMFWCVYMKVHEKLGDPWFSVLKSETLKSIMKPLDMCRNLLILCSL